MSKRKNNGILAGLLAGAAVGVIIGMLYAPKEGKETRKKLKAKAQDLKNQAWDEYDQLADQLKTEFGPLSEKAKENLDKLLFSIKDNLQQYTTGSKSSPKDTSDENETEFDALKQ